MKPRLIPEIKMTAGDKQALRRRLDAFYEHGATYTAFETTSHQVLCWDEINQEILHQLKQRGGPVRVLEVGAGRSGYASYLSDIGLRPHVHFSVQDVTTYNMAWLQQQADCVLHADVSDIESDTGFDVIFSTYVFEHVTDPNAHLRHLYQLLNPAGSLFIFCPRYDVPGYLCPSSRHVSWSARLDLCVQWGLARLGSLVSGRPAFLLQTDLAAFYQPFYRDADAVHCVSLLDLILWAKSEGATLTQLSIGTARPGSKDWIVKRLLTCAVQIHKPDTSTD